MFSSSLKGLPSDCYTPRSQSLHTFEQLVQVFLTQYASCQEYKRTRNHLFTLKMKTEESLKKYLTCFQTKRSKVHTYSNITVTTFINGMHVDHRFYKSLVKHGVTTMDEILHYAPGYILLEEDKRRNVKVTTMNEHKSRQAPIARDRKRGGDLRKPHISYQRRKLLGGKLLQ